MMYASSDTVAVASNVMYLGCYRYTKERLHTPSTKTVLLNSSDIAIRTHYFAPHVLHSPAMCAAYCAKYGNGHTLAGIGNYYHCLCGKGLDGNYKQKEISKCPQCSGDGRLRCGKSNTIAVYQSLTGELQILRQLVCLAYRSSICVLAHVWVGVAQVRYACYRKRLGSMVGHNQEGWGCFVCA